MNIITSASFWIASISCDAIDNEVDSLHGSSGVSDGMNFRKRESQIISSVAVCEGDKNTSINKNNFIT